MFILKISNAYNHLRNIVPDNDFQTYYQQYKIHPLLIAENAQCSYLYAKFHLKDKFPLGEPVIAKDSYCSKQYTLNVLKKNFYLDNKLICEYKI
jgi:hypothetical protein